MVFAKNGFYNYLQMIAGLFSVPIFTIILVGFITRKVPAIAAKTGLVFFMVSYGITQTLWDTGLHFLHVLAILFIITSILMLALAGCAPCKLPISRNSVI